MLNFGYRKLGLAKLQTLLQTSWAPKKKAGTLAMGYGKGKFQAAKKDSKVYGIPWRLENYDNMVLHQGSLKPIGKVIDEIRKKK